MLSEFKTENRPGVDINFFKEKDLLETATKTMKYFAVKYELGWDEEKILEVYRHVQDKIFEHYGMGD